MIIKNISGSVVFLDDMGYELAPGETLDLEDVGVDEIADSTDLLNSITTGTLVYLDQDGVTELTPTESADIQESNTQGIDLTPYAKKTDLPAPQDLTPYLKTVDLPAPQDLTPYLKTVDLPAPVDVSAFLTATQIQALIDAIDVSAGGDPSMITDIVQMPNTVIEYNEILTSGNNNSGSSKFYDRLSVPYYVDQSTTNRQVVSDIGGAGFFTGLLLPTFEDDDKSNRTITVFVTVDGTETSEIFQFSNDFSESLRLFIGHITDDKGETALLAKDNDDNDDRVTTNRKPQQIGLCSDKSKIPYPSMFLNDISMPKMKFATSLKVEYQCSHNNMMENSSYRNRAVAYYLLGDF